MIDKKTKNSEERLYYCDLQDITVKVSCEGNSEFLQQENIRKSYTMKNNK